MEVSRKGLTNCSGNNTFLCYMSATSFCNGLKRMRLDLIITSLDGSRACETSYVCLEVIVCQGKKPQPTWCELLLLSS